jgi:acyl carrier protein
MTRDELKSAIIEEIGNIAPDADLSSAPAAADLREAFDMDSMDIFNLVVALSQRLGIDIPDVDAHNLVTVGGGTEYLARRLGL